MAKSNKKPAKSRRVVSKPKAKPAQSKSLRAVDRKKKGPSKKTTPKKGMTAKGVTALQKVPKKPRGVQSPLASGRTLLIQADTTGEKLEILSPDGQTELSIRLTPDGPVLSMRGVRVEIESADRLAVSCREFEVNATEAIRIGAAGQVALACGGEMRLKSGGQTHIDGDFVQINCGDRTGYHDDPKLAKPDDAPTPPLLPEPPAGLDPGESTE